MPFTDGIASDNRRLAHSIMSVFHAAAGLVIQRPATATFHAAVLRYRDARLDSRSFAGLKVTRSFR